MATPLSDQIIPLLDQAVQLYYRLIFVTGIKSGKTTALHDVAQRRTDARYVNLNLELSQRLLPVAVQQRPVRVSGFLDELTRQTTSTTLLLDNIEILFDPSLKLQPVTLLQRLSRNRTIAVSWNGLVEDGYLVYARPGHPEYKRYPLTGMLVINPNTPI
jgi:hypothetical protein